MAGLFAESKGYVHISEAGALGNNSAIASVPLLILFGSQTGTAEKSGEANREGNQNRVWLHFARSWRRRNMPKLIGARKHQSANRNEYVR